MVEVAAFRRIGGTLLKTLLVLVVFIAAIVATGLAAIYSGRIDIAANRQGSLMDRVLRKTQEHAVAAHAARIADLDLAHASVPLGAAHYEEMCITCHGGPGLPASEVGQGLDPRAPDLAAAARKLKPREVYWIVKNGIRMTGMPSFGVTHNEEALQAITAFVLRLPGMSTEEFRALSEAGRNEPGGDDDAHEDARK